MKQIVFVDLDGTYVASNSFHRWLKYLAFSSASPLSPFGRARVLLLVGQRAAHGITHARLKAGVLETVAKLSAAKQSASADAFARSLAADIAAPVRERVESLRQNGAQIVLATAAPGNYAHAFANQQGFDDCLATEAIAGPDWHELLGPHKAAACAAYCAGKGVGADTAIAFTDHKDDLPLIRQSRLTIWCGPPEELTTIQSATPTQVIGLGDSGAGVDGMLMPGPVS